MRLTIAFLLLLWAAPIAHAATPAVPAAAETLTPAQAQQALSVLQDDTRRTQLLQVLRSVALATMPAPGTPAARAAAAPPTLGEQVVQALGEQANIASKQVSATLTAAANFPLLWDWLLTTFRSPTSRDEIFQATWRLALVFGCGIAADLLVYRLRRRPAASLEAMAEAHAALPPREDAVRPETVVSRHAHALALLRRLPLAFARLLLDLLGPAAFALASYLVLGIVAQDPDTREVVIAVLNAYLLTRLILSLARLLLAPEAPSVRLVPLSDADARTTIKWLGRLVVVATFGPALVSTSQMLGLYADAADALNKLIGLVFTLLLILLVLRIRHVVAAGIVGHAGIGGFVAVLRRRLAASWHLVAILVIVAAWVVWAFQVNHGFARILRLFLSMAVVVALARVAAILAFSVADRVFRVSPELALRYPGLEQRAVRYAPLARRVIGAVIVAASFVCLLQLWGIDVLDWFDRSRVGSQLLSAILSIVAVVLVTWVLWEGANALLDGQVAHLQSQAQVARAARLRTLAPILRTLLLVVMVAFLMLTILSQLGVNTAPLLAGASIFGVALGFGSQKLVQDFITGLFLLLENAMQVGDSVTVSGLSGTVEHLSVRTIRLRAGDGSVHIIPFSSVTSVTNLNRGLGNAAIGVTVAANEDTDRVGVVLKEIGAELREDAEYGEMIVGELALWGIDKVDGSGVAISGQIPCTDAGRWGVQREFNRRMKRRLQDEGIALAVPVQTVVVQHERDAPVRAEAPAGAATEEAAPKPLSPPPQMVAAQS